MQISITYVNPDDQRRHDTAAALMDLAEGAEALAGELSRLLNAFPVAQEPGDAADELWRSADDAVVTVYQLSYMLKSAARRI